MSMERTDVIVVGAGLAGLTAAQVAQRAGASVLVVDGQSAGGRARSDQRDGFTFNRGPHALYNGGAAERVLKSLGVKVTGSPPGAISGLRGDLISPLPTGARSLATTKLLNTRGKLAAGRFLGGLGRIDAPKFVGRSVTDWLGNAGLPADTEALVRMLIRVSTYANAPDEFDAGAAIMQMQMALGSGVLYLDGGWQSMVDRFTDGLTIRRVAATAVHGETSGVTVVTADGELSAGSAVVAVGTPAAAASLLGRAPFEVGPPIEAACLDLGLRRPLAVEGLLGVDVPLYLNTHCPPARLAPPGHAVVAVARYLARGDDLGPEAQRGELEAHARRAGLTPDDVVTERYLHRMTVVGALPMAVHGGLAGRPSVTDSGQSRVMLAGDWVGPEGHLADACLASGELAARTAARRSERIG